MANAKKIVVFFSLHLAYWLVVTIWSRALFILFYAHEFKQSSVLNLFNCFKYGFRLDLSIACYALTLPFILGVIYMFSAKMFFSILSRVFHLIVLVGTLLITIGDIAIYRHWNTKLNLSALQFATHPKEVIASIGVGDQPLMWLFAFIVSIILFVWLFYRIQRIIILPAGISQSPSRNFWSLPIAYCVLSIASCLFVLILGIRGGLQLEPINQSSAYFSNRPIENQAAINATWNLMNKVTANFIKENPYHFGSAAEVTIALNTFYRQEDTTILSLTSMKKPNIVFIILEGFTADVIAAFGGESGLTPTIDSLIKTGLIWNHFYANGDRTYKGLPALLNGHPTRPVGSVTQDPDQTNQIPSIAKNLKSQGYSSSFYYGGESEFANIKSYLINTGYDRIVDIKDFPTSYRGIKWGVPDHYVFERLASDLNQSSQPFFANILTLSTHEPYDIPIEPLIKSKTWPDLFRNTVYYADQSLGNFIQQVKDQPWYVHTIFVLTADHGNLMPKDYSTNFDPGKFKIPLLIFGHPLLNQYRGRINARVGSQTDLAYTLLSSLSMTDTLFKNSMNLMNPFTPGHAFYTFDHGFGLINDQIKLAYDLNGNKMVYIEDSTKVKSHDYLDSLIRQGKLLMQGTFDHKSSR